MTNEQEPGEDEMSGWDKLRLITETDEEYKAAWGDLYPYRREILAFLDRPIKGRPNNEKD